MTARVGNVFYWLFVGIAVFFIGHGFFEFFRRTISVPSPYFWYAFQPEYFEQTIWELMGWTFALVSYGIGHALRYLLARR